MAVKYTYVNWPKHFDQKCSTLNFVVIATYTTYGHIVKIFRAKCISNISEKRREQTLKFDIPFLKPKVLCRRYFAIT